MFVVSFGRMSYCEAPEWLDEECKVDLEIIHGKETLNLLGPLPNC